MHPRRSRSRHRTLRGYIPSTEDDLDEPYRALHQLDTTGNWGPRWWAYLHRTAAAYVRRQPYTSTQRRYLAKWLRNIQRYLPCPECRVHFRQHLQRVDVEDLVQSPEGLFKFLWRTHNDVNRRTGKPQMPLDVAVERYLP